MSELPEPPSSVERPPGHRRGAVAVVMRKDRFLVIRRSAVVRAPGAFCFPGGGIEDTESEVEAALTLLLEDREKRFSSDNTVAEAVERALASLGHRVG